jgi:hypothetical protein
MILKKFDTSGTELWSRQFPGRFGGALTADATGVYAAAAASDNIWMVKRYDPRGNELWAREFQAAPPTLVADGGGFYMAQPSGVRKYDSNGVPLWEKAIERMANAVAADATGVYLSSLVLPDRPTELRKLSPSGDELWVSQIEPRMNIRSIAVDSTGLYLAGSSIARVPDQCSSGGSDAAVGRYDRNGKEQWTRRFGTRFGDDAAGVAVHGTAIYVSGNSIDYRGWASIATGFVAQFEKSSAPPRESEPRIYPDCIVNAASQEGGGIAPGEIVTILGSRCRHRTLTTRSWTRLGRAARDRGGGNASPVQRNPGASDLRVQP